MLYIGGRLIDYIDDPTLVRAFGRSYEQNNRLETWLDNLITQQIEFRYDSINSMRLEYLRMINNGDHLYVRYNLHAIHERVGYIIIRMTGSRHEDEIQANAAIGLRTTPDGYTWHHAENIEWRENRLYCRMYLVETNYHRHRHVGGVNEYNAIMREQYH